MSLLNRPSHGLPSVLMALVRALTYLDTPPKREQVEALLAPGEIDRDQVRKTLNKWIRIGLLEENEGLIRISAPYQHRTRDPDVARRGLRKDARQAIFGRQMDEVADEEGERHPAQDFLEGISWYLAQDVYALPGSAWLEVDRRQGRQTGKQWPLVNDTRWQGLIDWGHFLGFIWPFGESIVPDPSLALGDCLGEIMDTDETLGISVFMTRAAEVLPVLDGGEYRMSVEAEMAKGAWHPPAPHQVSTSTSLALQRLERTGRIAILNRDDAIDRRELLLSAGTKLCSDVRRVS